MLRLPETPRHFRQPRGWFWRAIGRTYLRLGGWQVEGAFPDVPKCVTIVAPHTSNWDFPAGAAVYFAVELKAHWLGKHTLFKAPFDRFFRWMGGIPVDRSAAHGVVGACVKAFASAETFMLALAPEGTRKGVSQWKTGFYQIATQAAVPIQPVGIDFKRKVIEIMPLFHPTGRFDEDLARIQALFAHVQGLKSRPVQA